MKRLESLMESLQKAQEPKNSNLVTDSDVLESVTKDFKFYVHTSSGWTKAKIIAVDTRALNVCSDNTSIVGLVIEEGDQADWYYARDFGITWLCHKEEETPDNTSLDWESLVRIAVRKSAIASLSQIVESGLFQKNYLLFRKGIQDTGGKYTIDQISRNYQLLTEHEKECGYVIGCDGSRRILKNYEKHWVIVSKDDFLNSSSLLGEQDETLINRDQQITQQVEEKIMSNESRTVRIEFFDNDKGLKTEHSLVAAYNNIVTKDDNETTVRQLLVSQNIGRKIEQHNALRATQVDEEILRNTGNTVFLRPIEFKDLTIVVK